LGDAKSLPNHLQMTSQKAICEGKVFRNFFFVFFGSNFFLNLLRSPVWTLDFTFCAVITKTLFLPFFPEMIPLYVHPGLERGGGASGLQANIVKP
jgi:hypothetical protein